MKLIVKTPVQLAALAAISLSPCLFAQDETPAKPTVQGKAPEYCSISKVLGAKVRMNPGAEARKEAEQEGEAAKRPEGQIDDVLVDAHTGGMHYAVVAFGGFIGIGDKTVAVPISALTWNDAHERFELDASVDRLKALPAFDLGKARKAGLDNACETIDVLWRGTPPLADDGRAAREQREAKEATAAKKVEAKALAGTSFYLIPTRFVCATEIDDFPVYCGKEKYGKITDLFVDRDQRTISLAVVKRGGAVGLGGTEYLVPFRALNFCTSGEERVHCINCDAAKMETTVIYEKPKKGVVDPDAAKRALANPDFYKNDKEPSAKDR